MTTSTTHTARRPLRVLFVDRDGGSTQVAAHLLRHLAADRVEVDTAITKVADRGGRTDEMLVAMGLNPADDRRLSSLALHTADRVIVLATGLDIARLPGPRYEEWDLTEDDLGIRLQALTDELTAVPVPRRPTVLDRLRNRLRVGRR